MARINTTLNSRLALIGIVALCQAIAFVYGQEGSLDSASNSNSIDNNLKSRGGYGLLSIPGGSTAGRFLASASDGMSRYLASDGPIQPALTAIGALPLRATEMANRGITSISTGLDSAAQGLSRSSGQNGQIRMPGLDALESSMPASFASLGQSMHGAIQAKNNFIRGQAERGIAAGDRLRDMMSDRIRGLQARSSQGGHSMMNGMGNMMGQATEMLARSSSQIQSQLKKSLDGTMGRLSSLQGVGQNMRGQMEGLGRTMSSGLQGAVGHLQQTGEKMRQQLEANHAKNSQAMSNIMGSMQGSMGEMGSNMQKNLHGVMQHAQNAASTVTESLQNVISGPINMLSSLGSGMMKGGHGGQQQQGRY